MNMPERNPCVGCGRKYGHLIGCEVQNQHDQLDAKIAEEGLSSVMNQAETVSSLKVEITRLKDVLHIDRSGLAKAIEEIMNHVRSYTWVEDGRGCYEWDDDRYKEEAGAALRKVISMCIEALIASGNTAHAECCGVRNISTRNGARANQLAETQQSV
jgi:hypothetical protein